MITVPSQPGTSEPAAEYPIHDVLARRASAHAFSPRAVAPATLRSILEACTRRFEPIARSKGVALSVSGNGEDVTIDAPAEWLDRLVTVLVDNACRYAGTGGQVQLSVSDSGGSAVLPVDDSGPGIPEGERERVLERFHRASTTPGGAGLGLAIADAVVSATSGRWQIGTAPLGGARVQVTWHT